jgi:prophage regulatory protein
MVMTRSLPVYVVTMAEGELVDIAQVRLMGAAEIAARLKVVRQRAYQLTARHDFPRPRWELAMGQIWLADDVEVWIAEKRPYLNTPDDEA